MQIVTVIHHRIDPLRTTLDISLIDGRGVAIALSSRLIITDSNVYMGGHLNKMTSGRGEPCQLSSALKGCFGMWGTFHCMNQEMVRTGMVWIAPKHRLKDPYYIERALGRISACVPQLPGPEVHHAFCEEGRGVQIIRIFLYQVGHCILVVNREPLEVDAGLDRVAPGEGVDVGAPFGRWDCFG